VDLVMCEGHDKETIRARIVWKDGSPETQLEVRMPASVIDPSTTRGNCLAIRRRLPRCPIVLEDGHLREPPAESSSLRLPSPNREQNVRSKETPVLMSVL
jgi:hypothetical protein